MASTKFPWTPNQNHEQPKFLLTRLAKMVLKPKKSARINNDDKTGGPTSLPLFKINENDDNSELEDVSAEQQGHSIRQNYFDAKSSGLPPETYADGPLSLPFINTDNGEEKRDTTNSSEDYQISNDLPYKISWEDACGVDVDQFDDEIMKESVPSSIKSYIRSDERANQEEEHSVSVGHMPYKRPNHSDVRFDNDYNEIAQRKSISNLLPPKRYSGDYDGYEKIDNYIPNRQTIKNSRYSKVGSSIPNIMASKRYTLAPHSFQSQLVNSKKINNFDDDKVNGERTQGCIPKMLKSKRSKSVPNRIGSLNSIRTPSELDSQDDEFSILSSEIDRISINNSMLAAESLISFEDEIYHEIDEFPQTAKADFSYDEILEPYPNDLLDDIYKKNNLLEEIEPDLSREYSFKKTISGLYSVAMYRTQICSKRMIDDRDESSGNGQGSVRKTDYSVNRNITENLKEKLCYQKRLAEQAAMVVNLKKTDQSQKLNAIKSYIVSALTYKAVKSEISKWQPVQYFYEIYDQESGFASISNISICIENPEVLDSHFFMLAAVERESVKITDIKEVYSQKEDLQEILEFDNLRQDFIIEIFLYAISLKVKSKHNFLRKSSERFMNKKKGANKILNKLNSSAHHNITQLGTCQIHSFNMKNKQWQIKSTHRHLDQDISVNFECKIYVEPQHSGFFDIKYQGEDVEVNLRVWSRFWFQLAGGDLKGWPYPSDYSSKDPSRLISLSQCALKEVKPASKSICVRPNVFTFSLKLVDGSSQQILCAADSPEEMKLWCYQINKVIQHYKKCSEC